MSLPKTALAALTTVPDYDIDPLLLAGLEQKLSAAKAAATALDKKLGSQKTALAAMRAKVDQLQAQARLAHQLADDARARFTEMIRSAYMFGGPRISPALSVLLSARTKSPEDALSTLDMSRLLMTRLVISHQQQDLAETISDVQRTSQTAQAATQAAQDYSERVTKTQDDDKTARDKVATAQVEISARIVAVRAELAAKRAAQSATAGDATARWTGYLSTLGIYKIAPPSAAALRDPNHLPKGMSPIIDAFGHKQAGVARVHTASGDVLVLPREVVRAVGFALAQLGKPYVYAASGPSSFDCSGLVIAAYRSAATTSIPRISWDQYDYTAGASRIAPGQEMPGDLVFFVGDDGSMTRPGHVAIVIDPVNHLMIQAPQTGDVVKVSNYSNWGGLVGFGRVTTVG